MRVAAKDIFSLANLISIIGLSMTIWGAFNISHISGILVFGAGRLLDLVDGVVARRTHTSRLGAVIDATCDKLGLLFLLPIMWTLNLAPYWLLLYIFAQNLVNVVAGLIAEQKKLKATSSRDGKIAMFLQNICLGLFALANAIDINTVHYLALGVGILSIFWASRATHGYFRNLSN